MLTHTSTHTHIYVCVLLTPWLAPVPCVHFLHFSPGDEAFKGNERCDWHEAQKWLFILARLLSMWELTVCTLAHLHTWTDTHSQKKTSEKILNSQADFLLNEGICSAWSCPNLLPLFQLFLLTELGFHQLSCSNWFLWVSAEEFIFRCFQLSCPATDFFTLT